MRNLVVPPAGRGRVCVVTVWAEETGWAEATVPERHVYVWDVVFGAGAARTVCGVCRDEQGARAALARALRGCEAGTRGLVRAVTVSNVTGDYLPVAVIARAQIAGARDLVWTAP